MCLSLENANGEKYRDGCLTSKPLKRKITTSNRSVTELLTHCNFKYSCIVLLIKPDKPISVSRWDFQRYQESYIFKKRCGKVNCGAPLERQYEIKCLAFYPCECDNVGKLTGNARLIPQSRQEEAVKSRTHSCH